jgi:hypothetical protein
MRIFFQGVPYLSTERPLVGQKKKNELHISVEERNGGSEASGRVLLRLKMRFDPFVFVVTRSGIASGL